MSAGMDYEEDLRRRLKEARQLIAAHEGKKVGPYVVTLELYGLRWAQIVDLGLRFVKALDRGPDKLNFCAGASSNGDGYSCKLTTGDEIDPKHTVFSPCD